MLPRAIKEQFITAVGRMLRPVVRQLIAYEVTYPILAEMLKRLYVDVAEEHFALPFKRQTDSRLALVTGLNRKEVARLRDREETARPLVDIEGTVVTNVIGRWISGPPYSDDDGAPRRLPYESRDPDTPSFSQLVHTLGVDIPVRAIFDELLRLKNVELLPNGDVWLRLETHVPVENLEGKLALLGSDPAEVFSTIVHNLDNPDDPRLQRKVVYDNIGSDGLPDLRAAATRLGETFIRRANTLLAAHDRDRNPAAPTGGRRRVALGIYYFEEEAQLTPPPSSANGEAAPPGRIRRSK